MAAIRRALKATGVPVSFLSGTSGDAGFSRFHADVDMEALFEHLMAAEVIRQNSVYEMLDPSHGEPATERLLEHVSKAEELRQKNLRRILERAAKRK